MPSKSYGGYYGRGGPYDGYGLRISSTQRVFINGTDNLDSDYQLLTECQYSPLWKSKNKAFEEFHLRIKRLFTIDENVVFDEMSSEYFEKAFVNIEADKVVIFCQRRRWNIFLSYEGDKSVAELIDALERTLA
jgi:hypothetical protein